MKRPPPTKLYRIKAFGHPWQPDLDFETDDAMFGPHREYPYVSIALQVAVTRQMIEDDLRE